MATISPIFEDDDVLAVDKPEGLAAIPDRDGQTPSLFDMLCTQRDERLYIVHRIDKDTSGLLLFARNARTHRWLNGQFEARAVDKTYLALVHGKVATESGSIDAPLRQFGSGRMAVDRDRGKPSTTEFRIAQRLALHTLVEARPRTGRRHQIRVHLYHLGHPIVGDPLYGDKTMQQQFSRLMLHAWRLAVPLPSGETLFLEAPLPDSFQGILATLRS